MYANISKTMDELMEYTLSKATARNLPVSEFKMQKLIFKIKMELGQDHQLYPQLPYYWYLKGPYSEVAAKSYTKTLPRVIDLKPGLLHNYPEIEDITDKILDNRNYYINRIDRAIYKEYAPYDFMYTYKYEIYDIAKTAGTVDFNADEYINKINRCVARLPIDEYFYEFNSNFSKLSTDLDLINDSGNFQENWNSIKIPILETWKTFVKGLRVMRKDEFYNNLQQEWESEYEDYLINYTKLVNKTKRFN